MESDNHDVTVLIAADGRSRKVYGKRLLDIFEEMKPGDDTRAILHGKDFGEDLDAAARFVQDCLSAVDEPPDNVDPL